jgi:hypothetical protein
MRCRLYPRCLTVVLAVALTAAIVPAWAQTCTWGGTATTTPPVVSPLWADLALFRSPSRVAVDEVGNVYVTDPVAGRVFVRDAWGRLLSVKQGLHEPLAIAVDVFGTIYVGEAGTGTVTAFGRVAGAGRRSSGGGRVRAGRGAWWRIGVVRCHGRLARPW